MKVLLLGASGLLGHNVLHRLVASGHGVVAVVRRADAIQLDGSGWKTVVGRIDDSATVMAAAEGCDAIVNCAGVTDMGMLHREDYMPVNRDLCSTLVSVMEYHGIRTLVHASTVNTIGGGTPECPADESRPAAPPFSDSYYADSKSAGEAVLLAAAREHNDWHVVIVNPGFMLGPMDVKPSSGRMLLAGYRRPLMLAPKGGKAFVDVRDVAVAMVNALEGGRSGERYIAVNTAAGHLTIKQLYQLQASVEGYRQRVLTLPNWLLTIAGVLGDMLRTLGVRTELSTVNVRQLMAREYYNNMHAINNLQLPQTPIAQSIHDFHAWRYNRTNEQQKEK